MTKRVRENPSGSMGESMGLTQPHVLDCSTPSTIRPRPDADRIVPTKSSRGMGVGRAASWISLDIARMASTRTTSPTKTTRQDSSVVAQPPRIGPIAMPAPATPPMTA